MKRQLMLIDGEWVEAADGGLIDVVNPATEEVFAQVPRATEEDMARAIKAADIAFPEWAKLSLAAGCTNIAKPPSLTPLSPLLFLQCLIDVGVPRGVVNAVTGPGTVVGRQLITSPIVDKLAFTGSTSFMSIF